MISDHDAVVRDTAVFAARFRRPLSPSIAQALLQVATGDAIAYIRSDAVALLRQNPAASPHIEETLAEVARNDTNAGIRRQASEAIASINTAHSPGYSISSKGQPK